MIIELRLPVDATLLSQLMYEGILYLLSSVPTSKFNLSSVSLPEGSFCEALDAMQDERIEEITIKLTRNDNLEKFLESIGIREKPEMKTYKDLLKFLKNKCMEASIARGRSKLILQMKLGRDGVLLDDPKYSKLAAPQLFKVERYTGLSTAEMEVFLKQLGLRASPESVLIGLMGVYSSHLVTVRGPESTYHYFAFLSPEEVLAILSSEDRYKLESLFAIKERLRELLSGVLRSSTMSELMVLEVMLSTGLRAELRNKNLDKVEFNIFKISPEGYIYKIYETIPITVYSHPMFYEVLSMRGVRADKVCEILYQALSPEKAIMKALASFNTKNKYREADSVLRGVTALYRFVTLADPQHLFSFVRSLREACEIIKDDSGASSRLKYYEHVQSELSKYL